MTTFTNVPKQVEELLEQLERDALTADVPESSDCWS